MRKPKAMTGRKWHQKQRRAQQQTKRSTHLDMIKMAWLRTFPQNQSASSRGLLSHMMFPFLLGRRDR